MGSRIRDHRLSDAARPGAPLPGREEPLPSRYGGVIGFLRAGARLIALSLGFAEITLRFLLLKFRRGRYLSLSDRAQWLQASCRTTLRHMGVRLESRGTRPSQGLICSNHLSYVDIAVYAATTPCIFVSKVEVMRWPLFGFFARAGGTVFIDRSSRASTDAVAQQIGAILQSGVPVLLFPEGTSTDGATVQRFHPALLEPAVRAKAEITAAAIGYRVPGLSERAACWFGDTGFLPHLLRTLTFTGTTAEVEFYPEPATYVDRKAAALDLHEKVEAMRKQMKREASP